MHDKKRHETVLSLSMSKVTLAPLGLILAIALKDNKKNISINTLATKGGLRTIPSLC